MRKVLLCACGVALTAFGEDDLLDCVEGHLLTRHAGREAKAMERHFVTCGCGHEVWSADADELLALVKEHLAHAHPELVARTGREAAQQLTIKERTIADLVAAGRSNQDVAGSLGLTRKTVEWHLSRIYRKLGVSSRGELERLFATAAFAATSASSCAEPGSSRGSRAERFEAFGPLQDGLQPANPGFQRDVHTGRHR